MIKVIENSESGIEIEETFETVKAEYESRVNEYVKNYTNDMLNDPANSSYGEYVESFGYGEYKAETLEKAKLLLFNELCNQSPVYRSIDETLRFAVIDSLISLKNLDGYLTVNINSGNYRVNSDAIFYATFGEEEIYLDDVNSRFLENYPDFDGTEDYYYCPMHENNVSLDFDLDSYISDKMDEIERGSAK